ncbi:TonB-dependent receptor plug [Bacteroides helcogenes P 36-108]|uniref:TonB-dependent receptor plug n=2 Tax=Bacteroides helcogenes TaxID=290053 RepID=E6STR8_BACT6|nr:TonB-dependent receptor plug [Bacteroides helcogenes P 36-108]
MLMLLTTTCGGFVYASSGEKVAGVEAVQQSSKCTGIVKDGTGETIIGASVVVKGSAGNGTITGIDGDFTLSNVSKGSTLVISFVGYTTQEVQWKGTPLNIILKEDSKVLDEVVVVGFGTQKKANLTGAVSMVGADVIENRPVQNVSQALQGVIPGLNFSVNTNGGTLDNTMNVNIRGAGSIGDGSSASPLILIDGIEGNMNAINPNDIESVSVLKDAASASIYGARASFGVILIKTKSGKQGKTNVSYTGNVRFTDALQVPEMMDSYQFAQYFNAAAANAGQSAVFSAEVMERIRQYQNGEISYGTVKNQTNNKWANYSGANANTDWFKENYKDWVPSHEHNLSISGGNEKLTYRISGSFMDQNGLIRHGKDEFQRYTLDSKISAQLADWVTLNYTGKWTREDYSRPTYMTGLFFHNIARRWPTCPAYDPNGYIQEGMELIQMEDGGVQQQKKNYYTQQLAFVFEPLKDWHINVEGNMRTYNYNQHYEVLPVYAHDVDGNPYAISWDGGASYTPGQSRVYEYRYTEDYFTTNIYSDYSKSFGDHNFKVMGGFNAELTKYDTMNGRGDGLLDISTPWLSQTTDQARVSGGREHTAIAGFFGRINYNYKDRYMLELNGRYDGSSRFLADKRWGFFPSVSAGWNIAREEFFSPLADKISTLKLRASWGQLGNTNTKAWYPFYQTLETGNANSGWLVNGVKQNTAYVPGIVSSAMTWETVETWDIGLDWALLNNRLTGSFDWYTRYTYDMIGPAPTLASALGTSAPKVNNADMKAYGWELELGWRDRIRDFSYGVKLVLSDGQSKILRYPNETGDIDKYYAGRMMNEIWGYTTVGIAQTQAQMDEHLKNNKPTWGSGWSAGDIMYADLNNDGKVSTGANTLENPGDRRVIGNSTPRYNFGVTLDAAWKGFDFSMFWQGVAKRDYWLSGPYFWGASGGMWQSAGFKQHWDFWRPEGDALGANLNAYYPRASFDGVKNQYVQTGYLQNAAYLRLKNIQLGYTLPKTWVKKAGLQNVRIYVSGDNLLTISDITGIFDPETLGGDYGDGKLYPLCKTLSIGLNVNF